MRGRRDERDAERARREEKEQREWENKKREENVIWEEGGECIWEVYDESERWSEWRGEKMGAARTRGRMEENKREGWWGVMGYVNNMEEEGDLGFPSTAYCI